VGSEELVEVKELEARSELVAKREMAVPQDRVEVWALVDSLDRGDLQELEVVSWELVEEFQGAFLARVLCAIARMLSWVLRYVHPMGHWARVSVTSAELEDLLALVGLL
jgi:hypothetical protein